MTIDQTEIKTEFFDDLSLLGEKFGIEIARDLSAYKFVQEKRQILPYAFAKHRALLPLDEYDNTLVLAMANPLDLETIEEVRCITGKEVKEILCPKAALEEAIELCYHQKENEARDVIASIQQETNIQIKDEGGEGYDLLEQKSESPVIRMLNVMLLEAIQQGASDVHFEPLENGIGVRYRIDGVLQLRHAPKHKQPLLLLFR